MTRNYKENEKPKEPEKPLSLLCSTLLNLLSYSKCPACGGELEEYGRYGDKRQCVNCGKRNL